MSREKQIEEMACAMCGQDKICGGVGVEKCIIYPDYRRQANRLYHAGYRKQIEGEWIYNEDRCSYICSVCEECAPVDDYREPRLTDFCPNCGAKMKGGAE